MTKAHNPELLAEYLRVSRELATSENHLIVAEAFALSLADFAKTVDRRFEICVTDSEGTPWSISVVRMRPEQRHDSVRLFPL